MKKTGARKRPAAGRAARPDSIDEYLATVPDDQRRALGKLRKQIRAAAPAATEGISYGVPTFKLDGRHLVSFGAAAVHCSFYVGTADAMGAQLVKRSKDYETSKGTVRFAADKPLPAALVTRLVKARIARLKKGARY